MSPSNYSINVSMGPGGLPGLENSPKLDLKPGVNISIKTENIASPPGTSGLLSPSAIKKEVEPEPFAQMMDRPFYLDPTVNCLADVHKVLAEVSSPIEIVDQFTNEN